MNTKREEIIILGSFALSYAIYAGCKLCGSHRAHANTIRMSERDKEIDSSASFLLNAIRESCWDSVCSIPISLS